MPEYRYIPHVGKAKAIKSVKVRKGAPTSSAPLVKTVSSGSEILHLGFVLDGESVDGNPRWYLDPEGNFFWSGNVIEEPQKLLKRPLDMLVCTQKFGSNPALYANYGSPKGHNGLDFRTRLDANPNDWKRPVYSVMEGVVAEASFTSVNGNFIRINHPNQHQSVYLHLSAFSVQTGQNVTAGQKIGTSGNSGSASTAPHLHFGYRPLPYDVTNGYMGYIDPAPHFIDNIQYV